VIINRWGRGAFFLVAIFAAFACSESRQQSADCNSPAVAVAGDASALEHEVTYNAFNSTFLQPEVAKLYGIDQDEKLGVVMVSVYQTAALGVGVEACVSGGVTNLIGQVFTLEFDEIREGQAIYHIGTFSFGQEERLTFEVDVEIAATGETHELKWKQQFWQG
jgi:hypothetical protein